MAFKFYIDSQLTDQPVNDTALSTTIKRDNNIGGMVVTQDVRLIYNGNNDLAAGEVSGYTILKDAFDSGTCSELVFNIYDEIDAQTTLFLYAGIIKVPDIEINEQRIEASVEVQDNSFYAYINNNKSIEYNIQSIATKNRETIAAPDIYEVDCFESVTGIYGSVVSAYFRGYRVYDVFKYLVAALSDNKISFASTLLQTEPELFIFDSSALVNPNTNPSVIVSFAKLFDEVNKIKNIAFYIDTSDQLNPTLRIENKSTLYSSTQIYSFDSLKELIDRVNTDRIYGTIRVGDSDNPTGPDQLIYTFEAGTSYIGWKEEIYAPLGQCNIDNELNLVSDFGITSNDIQDQLVGAVTPNDKLYLIECDNIDSSLLLADAVRYNNWINRPEYYYNKGTYNPAKLLNHGSNFQTGLTNTLEIGGNGFRAERGQDILIAINDNAFPQHAFGFPGYTLEPVVFTDETSGNNYDGGGNYDNTLGDYTCPLDGVYSFNTRLILDMINFPSSCPTAVVAILSSPIATIPAGNYYPLGGALWGAFYTLTIEAFTDATYTTLVNSADTTTLLTGSQTANISCSLTSYLPAGSVVRVKVNTVISRFALGTLVQTTSLVYYPALPNPSIEFLNANGWSIQLNNCGVPTGARPTTYAALDSWYSCTGAPDGGGITIENDPALYKNKEYQFTEYISQTDFQTIKANPTGLIYFEKDGLTRYGWIQDLKRNDWTGQTQIKLISDNAST